MNRINLISMPLKYQVATIKIFLISSLIKKPWSEAALQRCSYKKVFIKYTLFYKQHLYKTPGWNWQKIKQMLSNNLRLNFCYLKVIRILHQRYHSKIIGHILKNKQKNKVCLYSSDFTIDHNENEDENEKRSHSLTYTWTET